MSETAARIPLGDIDPCGSRQAGRRSGITLTDSGPVVGLVDGTVRAFDHAGAERWSVDGEASAITLVPFGSGVLVGERSKRGTVRLLEDGTERWRHDAADAVGDPTKETRFFLPMVVDAVTDADTAYVAARRYERRDGARHFESSVYALASDGTVRWRYDADASPISLAAFDGGVAVAYNRCPGEHDDGVVVLDSSGSERWVWDADRTATRRIGDVAAADGSLFVTSHADYRGYRLRDGEAVWSADLGTQRSSGDEVYTYPNHVHASVDGVVFLTGNTFPEEGRETDERHPNEQTAFGYSRSGTERWREEVGGFSHGIAADGSRLLVPVAQHFRERDPSVHGWRSLDVTDGLRASTTTDGVVTAAAVVGDSRALVEEPVRYHDDGTVRGRYALHVA
ncbi:PQQ-binding-like beta-propeller repeat protein [Natronomonas gomsonensis]|uniref:PQQ-binding-like beta-propeller repeat protein n=1 Tax=Natronomonas gomsonensis TaxID=1046043 RepID=UPI0015BFA768|nr:PQQ-binding-like beta-propeller repeat protein [Natronomonas gomsonensis]